MSYEMDANAIMQVQEELEAENKRLREALENIKQRLYAKEPIVEMYRLADEALMQSLNVHKSERTGK